MPHQLDNGTPRQPTEWNATLVGLRDFFAARDGLAMVSASVAVIEAARASSDTNIADFGIVAPETAEELEYAFNRLFVGPRTVVAPPYASVYLDSDRRLMGNATRAAVAAYHELGVLAPSPDGLPEDHLALELEAALVFRDLIAHGRAEFAAPWRRFLLDHLAVWTPAFVQRVLTLPDVSPTIRQVATQLSAWVADETQAYRRESVLRADQPRHLDQTL
ncbi:hypothetical protein CCR94_10100 [Rhodoblastus sphagnicola]|uniref:Molecular chaperone TorD n=1 Tax=Rhodoblastus sphagnicola TaxID=333368 RepID=A0A2S6N959_9HYPH|nr:molecular chaperone TorD family protein [Rhodoblastus sphagnicola]MBB4200813.1 TorA maturation chaperone TorD [Rhodoblastus sphagnicola]PPQ31153.1 hypothetical protein CCR94_10100 [Rhodoblastus sphagnicola]